MLPRTHLAYSFHPLAMSTVLSRSPRNASTRPSCRRFQGIHSTRQSRSVRCTGKLETSLIRLIILCHENTNVRSESVRGQGRPPHPVRFSEFSYYAFMLYKQQTEGRWQGRLVLYSHTTSTQCHWSLGRWTCFNKIVCMNEWIPCIPRKPCAFERMILCTGTPILDIKLYIPNDVL
jgi:hypothetical protein